jgi:hypothetical protein
VTMGWSLPYCVSSVLVFTNVFICFLFQWGALADEDTFTAIRSQCNETFHTPSGKCIGCGVLLVCCSHIDVSKLVTRPPGAGDSDRPSGPSTLLPKEQQELLTRRNTMGSLTTHVYLVPRLGMLGAAPPFLHTP